MSVKREEKKKLYTAKILTAANKIFTEYGFKNSTMELIAKEANVGVGTAYLYFKSKSELFKVTMEMNLKAVGIGEEFEKIDYNSSVTNSIYNIIVSELMRFNTLDKKVLRDFYIASLQNSSNKKNTLYDIIKCFDDDIKNHIVEILETFKKNNRLKTSFDTKTCAELILDIILSSYGYVFDETMLIEEVFESIRLKIEFIFKPYLRD